MNHETAWATLRAKTTAHLANLQEQTMGFTSDEQVAAHQAAITADENLLELMREIEIKEGATLRSIALSEEDWKRVDTAVDDGIKDNGDGCYGAIISRETAEDSLIMDAVENFRKQLQ